MNRILLLVIVLFFNSITVSAQENNFVLKAEISKINYVPKQFFGTWSVLSTRTSTDSEKTFAQQSVDLWNLRRSGNVIELRNPVTTAVAEIYLEDVTDKEIVFTHYEKDGNTLLKDTVKLTIGKDTFVGTNIIKLETRSKDSEGRPVLKTKYATYNLKGTKVSGLGLY